MVAATPFPFAVGMTTTVCCSPSALAKVGTSPASGPGAGSAQALTPSPAMSETTVHLRAVMTGLQGKRCAECALSGDSGTDRDSTACCVQGGRREAGRLCDAAVRVGPLLPQHRPAGSE